MRVKGCALCCSPLNSKSANIFAERGDEIIEDLEAWGLTKIRASLLQTRQECMQKCLYVTNIIYPCIEDGLTLIDNADDILKLPIKELIQNKASCCSTLKRILYHPSISARGMAIAKSLCAQLEHAGHKEAARILWLYVAWTHEDC